MSTSICKNFVASALAHQACRQDFRTRYYRLPQLAEKWHLYLNDPTLADAILDRLVHNSYRLNLKGDSMRAKHSAPIDDTTHKP